MFILCRRNDHGEYICVASKEHHDSSHILKAESWILPNFLTEAENIFAAKKRGLEVGISGITDLRDIKGINFKAGKESLYICYSNNSYMFHIPPGCSVPIPTSELPFWQFYRHDEESKMYFVRDAVENRGEEIFSEQEIFKYLCIAEDSQGQNDHTWRFFEPVVLKQFGVVQFEADNTTLFEDMYYIDDMTKLITNLECFLNSESSTMPYPKPPYSSGHWVRRDDRAIVHLLSEREHDPTILQFRQWRQKLFKVLWAFLYDESAVGEEMAEKINYASYCISHGEGSYEQIQEELKQKFGAAGEGAVMTMAKLVAGKSYTVRDKSSLALFNIIYSGGAQEYKPLTVGHTIKEETAPQFKPQVRDKFHQADVEIKQSIAQLEMQVGSLIGLAKQMIKEANLVKLEIKKIKTRNRMRVPDKIR